MSFVLICLGAIALVAVLALVPVAVAWSRRHRKAEAIVGVTVVWALLAAASLLLTTIDQMKWVFIGIRTM